MGDLGSRIKAMELAAKTAKSIIDKQPDLAQNIADDYRELFAREVAEKRHIAEEYNLNKSIARTVVIYIVRGYKGSEKISSFEGLIKDKNELDEIKEHHQKRRGKIAAAYNLSKNNTKFGLTPEQLAKVNKKRGIKGGMKCYLQGKGVHSKKYLKKRRSNGIKGAMKQGHLPWTKRKRKTEFGLMSEGDYIYYHSKKLKSSLKSIVYHVNQTFHNGEQVRSYNGISSRLSIIKKQKTPHKVKTPINWTDQERLFTYEFFRMNMNYPNFNVTDKRISDVINHKFHNGKKVRTKNSIYRQRKIFEKKYTPETAEKRINKEILRLYKELIKENNNISSIDGTQITYNPI